MRERMEGRFQYRETPILYEVMKDEKYLQDMPGFITVQIRYHDGAFPEILKDIRLSAVDAVYTDITDETFLSILKTMGLVIYHTSEIPGAKKIRKFGRKIWTIGGYKHFFLSEAAKTVLDKIGGAVGCAIFGVLFVTVGPLIKLDSRGPILFKQERVGLNGRRFMMYKFRTMKQDAERKKETLKTGGRVEDHMLFKIEDDERITKLGHVLRRTSLDEFPQFWNVLKGDMSIVGTRPPTIDEFCMYKPSYRKRLVIKPGITGVWQVNGRHSGESFQDVMNMDMSYVEHGNVFRYLSLILKTLKACSDGKGM